MQNARPTAGIILASKRELCSRLGGEAHWGGLALSRLLIVDDNDSVLFAMRGYFDNLGYSVECARTENDARDHLAAEPYDAVVSDLSLTPGNTEGLEVVKWARERCPGARILVLTAYGTPENEAEARRLGVDAFLRKPVRLSDLHKLLEDLGHQYSDP